MGRELLLALAQHLAANYGREERVTELLDTVELHIMPTLNPDGFETKALFFVDSVRNNGHGVDLNRAFPTWRDLGQSRAQLLEAREPEVAAAAAWILDQPWVLSANFHDGAVVANYPWDDEDTRPWERSPLFRAPPGGHNPNYTPDHAEFVSLARLYAGRHATMADTGASCVRGGETFEGGVTNGVEWYAVSGGMQDFNYLFTNCMEITLELSCVKKPGEDKLQAEWEANKEALLSFIGGTDTSME